MKTRIATFVLVILIPLFSFAQETMDKMEKEYEFKDASKTETVYIEINKSSSTMLINFIGSVETGTLDVKVFDPKGEKMPGFHLVSEASSDDESIFGISDGSGSNSVISSSSKGSTTTVSTSSSSSGSSSSGTTISSGKSSKEKSSEGTAYTYISSTSEKGAKGVVNKVVTDPKPGKWKVVISAKKLTGKLSANIEQY